MIGIYQDSFIDYLRENLGNPIKTTSKNIICRCPWCEYKKEKPHYHCYISLELPIFHCFHAGCEQGGNLKKFLTRVEGSDISEKFVDKDKIKKSKEKTSFIPSEEVSVKIPSLNVSKFPYKGFYIRKRLKFADVDLKSIKGLVFDINEFIELNGIVINPALFRIRDYLHSNFVGFLTEYSHMMMLRNIDHRSSFPFFKLKIQDQCFLDYYRLPGKNPNSNMIVLGEGIFDIFSEHIFDSLGVGSSTKLYASVLSSKYASLIKSIVFHEQVFRFRVIVLSDKGVDVNYYKSLKRFNSHIIESLTVYYNREGKDFGDTPVVPVKFVI